MDGHDEFAAFVTAVSPELLRFAFVLTADAALSEDLVQQAFIKTHRHWRADRLAYPGAYLRRAVLNEYLSWRRRRVSWEQPGEIPDVPVPDTTDAHAERDLLWRALGTLPRRQRAVLTLRFYDQLDTSEIADLLGCGESTVRAQISRGLGTLRASTLLNPADPALPADHSKDRR